MSESKSFATLDLPHSVTFADATACSAMLQKKMFEYCDKGFVDKVVTIDAGAVEDFDSSVLAVLLQCRRDAAQKNRTITIMNISARLRELTKLYGVADLLPDA